MKMLLGFDIGGTKCAVILGQLGATDEIVIIDKISTATSKPAMEMIALLYSIAEDLMKKNQVSINDITGIGISCGGPLNSKTGIILSPPNLPGWDNIPIVKMMESRFGKKTILQNDANACALAEWKYGAGKGKSNIIFLTFGTGMGAGLILNGKLYSGTTDLAGEVGHLRLAEMGPVGFGKAGSFEGYCSGGGIAQLAQIKVREKLQMGEEVSYCNNPELLPSITAKSVAAAAMAGDALAIEIYKICGIHLGKGLSVLIDILNPEMIIIGSIFGRARQLIEPYMREVINREALAVSASACSIVPAALAENIGDVAALTLAAMA